jgi:glycerol-3-phosphate acyltransferase PlsY
MVVLLVLTYLLGAVPFGVIVTTLWGGGDDLREAGSGNIGATNAARVFGWRLAVPVLLLDMGKGLVPVLLARLAWPDAGPIWWGLVALAAFAGHCWPVFLEFRGGKGVATDAGAIAVIAPFSTAIAGAVWLVGLLATGRSSVAALLATAALVVACLLREPLGVDIAVLLIAVGILVRHTANVERLLRGTEEPVAQVRWQKTTAPATGADVLQQDPSGAEAKEPVWRD